MKIKTGLFTALAVVTFGTVSAFAPRYVPVNVGALDEDQERIRGVVKHISPTRLILAPMTDDQRETVFALTNDTKYLKDGVEAKADVVKAGAYVAVKAVKDPEDIYEAVEVHVVSSKPQE